MIRILLSTKLGEMKWSQADLARATGIRPNTISELYHEYTDRVNLEHLDLICEALHCELDELIVRVPNDYAKITHTRTGSLISSDKQCCNTTCHRERRSRNERLFLYHNIYLHSMEFLSKDFSKISISRSLLTYPWRMVFMYVSDGFPGSCCRSIIQTIAFFLVFPIFTITFCLK